MASNQSTEQTNFQKATQGAFGHNLISDGETSVANRVYFSVKAFGDCTISYDKHSLPYNTNGDASVTGLLIADGNECVLGAVENISVSGGTIMAHLVELF